MAKDPAIDNNKDASFHNGKQYNACLKGRKTFCYSVWHNRNSSGM